MIMGDNDNSCSPESKCSDNDKDDVGENSGASGYSRGGMDCRLKERKLETEEKWKRGGKATDRPFGERSTSRESIQSEQWRGSDTENRFFGKRSLRRTASKDEQWRGSGGENKFFGERSSRSIYMKDTNWRANKQPTSDLRDQDNRTSLLPQELRKPRYSRSVSKKKPTFDIPDLLQKEGNELVSFLVENISMFCSFLALPLATNEVIQVVFVMEKVCAANANLEFVNVILSRICNNLMRQLDSCLVKLSLDEEEDKKDAEAFWSDPDAFWSSLIDVFETICSRFPALAKKSVPKVIKASLITIEFHENLHGTCISSAIKVTLKYLANQLKILKKVVEQPEDIPDDLYRHLNVYPEPAEVLTSSKPYIRCNIVEGTYNNVDHYLGIHFQLLKEDFIAPLREAILTYKECQQSKKSLKITEFRVYTHAHFIQETHRLDYPIYDDVKYTYDFGRNVRQHAFNALNPGVCTQKYINTYESFMYGSLLCFSSDNFETMFFGTVVLMRGTENGFINVQLLQNIPFLHDQTYTMLECKNYFGTNYSVLKALQCFDSRRFPMEKYIIRVENIRKPPAYLTNTTQYTVDRSQFPVLNFELWPSKDDLNLNEMQYEAFKQALTSEFALIQGPPGTGKTYLGLKIAQTIIENNYDNLWLDEVDDGDDDIILKRRWWSSSIQFPPILVVAYTNHALDQFLEGLTPFTNNIVRFGKQCSNKAIMKYVFSERSLDREILHDYYKRVRTILMRNYRLMTELESVMLYCGIFDVSKIAVAVPNLQKSPIFCFSTVELVYWLLGDSITEHQRQERWEMVKEIDNGAATPTYGNTRQRNKNDDIYEENYKITISTLQKRCQQLQKKLEFKDAVDLQSIFTEWNKIEERYARSLDNLHYLQWRMRNAKLHSNLYAKRQIPINDPFSLPYNDRWILYFHWLDLYIKYLQDALERNRLLIAKTWEEMEQNRQEENICKVAGATVVGMTTSCAARYQHLLQHIKCPVVIVEEAAEVLESHIVTSLTSDCQHLILIGDHQQLRPSTADYRIEKQYKLGISLFERMVRNKVPYSSLEVQHRMRPEMSELIAPSIYPNLKNHNSVYNFPNVGGILHNVFFIDHKHPEIEIGNSRQNPHEAKYVLALARHLILQGYEPSEITILSTYKGQMYEIQTQRFQSTFKSLQDVRVTVVDNFQGEENEIILLSLVRSNNENSIGFLAIENRVCVALSRAKKGFYIIGNMNILTENSKIWPKVKEVLTENGRVGPGLPMACQLHPEKMFVAVNPEDFENAPDGGCDIPCGETLQCGHVCRRKCHVTDVDHNDYRCMESCERILCANNHVCTRKCWAPCGPCHVPINRLLPCDHLQPVPCSVEIEDYKCLAPVETLLACGHQVQKPCSTDINEFKCLTEVEESKPGCGHVVQKLCHEPVTEITCYASVLSELKCGHSKKHCCVDTTRFKQTNECTQQCLKVLACGHVCQRECHFEENPQHTTKYACFEKCSKLREGCRGDHKCGRTCSEPCESCMEDVKIDLPCGHFCMVKCNKSDKKYKCQNYCKKTKPCGHLCYSKCHEVCDSVCNIKVRKSFLKCRHTIKVNCSEDIEERICMKCARQMKKVTRP